jgi:ribosomal protein S4E
MPRKAENTKWFQEQSGRKVTQKTHPGLHAPGTSVQVTTGDHSGKSGSVVKVTKKHQDSPAVYHIKTDDGVIQAPHSYIKKSG